MIKKLVSNSGFTLVEILVSLVIISILVSAFSIAFLNSNKSIRVSKNKTKAFTESQEILIHALGDESYEPSEVKVTEDLTKTITFGGTSIDVELDEVEVTKQYKGFNNQEQDIKIKTYRIIE
mgnify:CR=1 FL=1